MSIKEKYKKALNAIELASEVMDYSRGDSWERECTEESYNKFNTLKNELIPKKENKTTDEFCYFNHKRNCVCPQCNKTFTCQGLVDHYNSVHFPILKNNKRDVLIRQIYLGNYENLKVIC